MAKCNIHITGIKIFKMKAKCGTAYLKVGHSGNKGKPGSTNHIPQTLLNELVWYRHLLEFCHHNLKKKKILIVKINTK